MILSFLGHTQAHPHHPGIHRPEVNILLGYSDCSMKNFKRSKNAQEFKTENASEEFKKYNDLYANLIDQQMMKWHKNKQNEKWVFCCIPRSYSCCHHRRNMIIKTSLLSASNPHGTRVIQLAGVVLTEGNFYGQWPNIIWFPYKEKHCHVFTEINTEFFFFGLKTFMKNVDIVFQYLQFLVK